MFRPQKAPHINKTADFFSFKTLNGVDWQTWLNWVQHGCYMRCEWVGLPPNATAGSEYLSIQQLRHPNGERPVLKIVKDRIAIHCYFFCDEEIENDIDPREIRSWGDHVRLLNYLKIMSYVLKKEVILTPESCPTHVLLSVTHE